MLSHVYYRLIKLLDPNLVCAVFVLGILCSLITITTCALAIGHVDFFRFKYAIRFYLCFQFFT